jgi:hypothetical protein
LAILFVRLGEFGPVWAILFDLLKKLNVKC